MIDRITDAGQCDYYEMIIKVIIRDERENVCDLSNINMEKKAIRLRIFISSFVHCYGNQKSLRIAEEEKTVQR